MSDTKEILKAPFPYFGGKSRAASLVWERFGKVRNYVEPFFGSGAMMLARPEPEGTETVNDADGMVANFWRAMRDAPDAVAEHADNPVFENDLHARHAWLVGVKDSLQAALEGNPDFYDAKVAGWWAWGLCGWIGSGFCSGKGPWRVEQGKLIHVGSNGMGVNRQRIRVGGGGRGVNRQLIRVGGGGRGVNRSEIAMEENSKGERLREWFSDLAERLAKVHVCCGDWSRLTGPSVTTSNGLTAVFLDPPYANTAERAGNLYRVDSESVAHEVREWAIANGGDCLLRIALCGYEGEHAMPGDWECVSWKAKGGYGSQSKTGNENAARERIWFSPACERPRQRALL